jgi:hypothetical protein
MAVDSLAFAGLDMDGNAVPVVARVLRSSGSWPIDDVVAALLLGPKSWSKIDYLLTCRKQARASG